MRLSRLFIGALTTGVVSVSPAVMDLQFVKRWNLAGPLVCNFKQIVATPEGGYVGLGTIGNRDLALVTFDAGGSVLATKRWDSPLRKVDEISKIEVDSEGNVYMLASGGESASSPQLYLVKFDGDTLAQMWERTLLSPSGNFTSFQLKPTGTGASEVIVVATAHGGVGATIQLFTKQGTIQGTTNLAYNADFMCVISGPMGQPGVILGGRRDLKPWILQLSSAGSALLDHQINLANAQVNALGLTTGDRIVAGGGPLTGAGHYVWRHNPNNSWSQFSDSVHWPVYGMARAANDTFVISTFSAQGNKVRSFNAVTGVFTSTLDNPGFMGKVVVNESINAYSIGDGNAHGVASPLGAPQVNSVEDLKSTASVGQDLVSVGMNGALFSYRLGLLSMGITVPGYIQRDVADALPDGQGGIYQILYGSSSYFLQRLNASGGIVWTRALTLPGVSDASFVRLDRFSNGDLAVGGRANGGFSFARVTTAGVVSASRRVASLEPAVAVFKDIRIDSQDRVWFFGAGRVGIQPYASLIVRMAADGSNQTALSGAVGIAGYRKPMDLPGGFVAALAGQSPTKLVWMDVDGNPQVSADVSTSDVADLAADQAGRLATVGVVAGGLEVTVRETNFSPSLQTTIANATSGFIRFAPGGEIRVVYQVGSEFHIRSYTNSGAMAWDQTLPATVESVMDLDIDSTNGWAYVGCTEGDATDQNVNVIRYLANGVRSAQRRTAGRGQVGMVNGAAYWMMGSVTTRGKAREAFAAKWNLP